LQVREHETGGLHLRQVFPQLFLSWALRGEDIIAWRRLFRREVGDHGPAAWGYFAAGGNQDSRLKKARASADRFSTRRGHDAGKKKLGSQLRK
jgi:hypothetical protein